MNEQIQRVGRGRGGGGGGGERRGEGSWVDGRTDGWTDGQPDFSKQILNVCVCLFRSAINSTSPNLSFKRF